jgi:glycosyltransferase involved in cell wall biosynthesis
MTDKSTKAAAGRGVILMAVYNGAPHLDEQVQSLTGQTRQDWDLMVSDDGSQDGSREGLAALAAQWRAAGEGGHGLTLLDGPGRGLVRNFFHLLRQMPETAAYAALSDQDDVWFPDKLARALAALAAIPAGQPALYCARSMICDADLRPLRPSTRFHRPPGFRNALVQSAGGGNTMVLNPAAIALVRAAVSEAEEAAVHDWWLYQIVTACGGTILRDPEPALLYRQHGRNAIGVNTSVRGRIHRILFIMGRRFSAWNEINLRALTASRHRFTPEAQAVLEHYAQARQGGVLRRLRALAASGVYRQSRLGTLALYAACLFGRL